MDEAHYYIGSGIWMLGEGVRLAAILGAILALPGLIKKDRTAVLAIGISVLAVSLLYISGWHAFVHHGV